MSVEKVEAIILGDKGIMIQEMTFLKGKGYEPVLKIPPIDVIMKITEGCKKSVEQFQAQKTKEENKTALLDMLFEPTVEKYGRENVTINEDKSLTVIENGKEHRIWVE